MSILVEVVINNNTYNYIINLVEGLGISYL